MEYLGFSGEGVSPQYRRSLVEFRFNMKMKKGLFLFGGLILVGMSIFLWKSKFLDPKFERIIFSHEKYPDYRKQIASLLNKKYDGISIYPEDMAIAVVDLNGDGLPEIIVYSMAGGISGSGGGYTGFYQQTPSGLKLLSDSCLTAGTLYKSNHKTNGYHDVLSYVVGWKLDPERDRKLLLAWDKKRGYDYVWMKKISQKEREREVSYEQNL